MESVQFVPDRDGFTLVVQPTGWTDQTGFLWATAILFALAALFTYAVCHGFPINNRPGRPFDSVYASPLWVIGLITLAVGFQRAYRKVVFVADAENLVIASAGPLGKTTHQFPRRTLQAILVGNSHISIDNRPLRQLQLYFSGRNTPFFLLTGRMDIELVRVAEHLIDGLHLTNHAYSADEYMEIRLAPIHLNAFKALCGIGTAIGLGAVCFRSVIGDAALVIAFFSTVILLMLIGWLLMRTCRCPKCQATLKRDQLSPQGNFEYTCPACRIVWQSPIRIGGPHSH